MYLEWLQIGRVRNLHELGLEPGPGFNIFTGRNAAGKTAILEAIYLLARARSFRTPRIQEVVTNGHKTLQVTARAGYTAADFHVTTGIEKGRGRVTIRYNGAPVRTVSEQARQLPLVLVSPDSHELATGTPKQRRHWLDWAMFHVEPGYLDRWRDYMKALRHRNSLLKEGVRDSGRYLAWEQAMARSGTALHDSRREFVQGVGEVLAATAGGSFNEPLSAALAAGWEEERTLADCLAQERQADLAAGFSRRGPHRADILFSCGADSVSARFSRGQIKLFVCLLSMAEAVVLERMSGEAPVFLLDDYAAELDEQASASLLQSLMTRGWQTFITTTALRETDCPAGPARRFHVEHGAITKVVE